jgi:hypothetical protein
VRGLIALIAGLVGLCLAGAAPAQVTSSGPDRVAVTIYRAPNRDADDELDRDWLRGYALITETRTIAVPAGRATIRLEGVAAGILPESAIVTGLPHGVREKNLDADLLSPRSLYARSFGRPVTIRRTVAGKTVEERAIIRSGPDGPAILQTKGGFIAADCGTADEELVYDGVPRGLSARPTLSIETDAPRAGRATVTLSYLAWGFDWQANYVATMRPDGRSADLFAWVTLASSDTTSFADAETIVVAGTVAREDSAPDRDDSATPDEFEFRCFSHPAPVVAGVPPAAPMAYAADRVEAVSEADIVVTGSRVRVQRENLGDLKLYRVPDRTTVAAMAMKQVALLERRAVPVSIVYLARLAGDDSIDTPWIALRAVNRKERGLGLPLPAGPVAVFEPHGGARLLIGEGSVGDKAEGEDVEVKIAEATQVTVSVDDDESGAGWEGHVLTVRNANPYPISFEATVDLDDQDSRLQRMSATLSRKDGKRIWAVEVPANGTRTLRYRLKDDP